MLGVMLLSASVALQAVDVVAPEDFFRSAHRQIFESMRRIVTAGSVVDLVTIKNDLALTGLLDECGGPAYISALVDGVPRSSNWEHYAKILKELKRRRDLVFFGNKVMATAYDGGTESHAIIAEADGWLSEVAGDATAGELTGQREAMIAFCGALEYRIAHRNELVGLSTGFPSLDDICCGMVAQDVTVLAADTSGGKTGLALNIAIHAAQNGHSVVFVSLEMAKIKLENRIASVLSGVEQFKIRKGWLSDREVERVATAMGQTTAWPLWIDDTSSVTVRELRARIRRLAIEHRPKLVVIDYVQLLTADRDGQRGEANRALEVAKISRGLKLLARELNAAFLVLSQFSRAHSKDKRRPQLHDLKESSGLEQDADNVWLLFQTDDDPPITELIIAKQRDGPLGKVDLRFDKPTATFHDLNAEAQAAKVPEQVDVPFVEEVSAVAGGWQR